ncbi:type II toxin-antitoxin system PemK/MazF family toxin [Candidatus Woesearchaeota archaeon]|nr:type II toxin-antitoxin system PemK/MazF family toxin [Candidatus Woesearchaeota archaeon]
MEKVSLEITQREIVLLPFPYSDLSGKKIRPVIVVSNDKFNSSSKDLIVCAITLNVPESLAL